MRCYLYQCIFGSIGNFGSTLLDRELKIVTGCCPGLSPIDHHVRRQRPSVLAVNTGDGQLTAGVAAYNKDLKSTRKMNTIQVFALTEDVAKKVPLPPAASATNRKAG